MNGNLLSTLWPKSQALHKAALVALGVVILTLASKVQVPFWPVPMTLQTLAVLMIAATSGARLGTATVLAWLALGAVGAPVFAGAVGGPAYICDLDGGRRQGSYAEQCDFLKVVQSLNILHQEGGGADLLEIFLK